MNQIKNSTILNLSMCSRLHLIVKAKSITFNDISDFIVSYPAHHLPFSSHLVLLIFLKPTQHCCGTFTFFLSSAWKALNASSGPTPLLPVLAQILPSWWVQFWPPQFKLHPTNASFLILLNLLYLFPQHIPPFKICLYVLALSSRKNARLNGHSGGNKYRFIKGIRNTSFNGRLAKI